MYCVFQIDKKTNKHEDHVESENLPHDGHGALTCSEVFETSDSGVHSQIESATFRQVTNS